MPTLTVTASGEHHGFPGTLSIGAAVMEQIVVELVRSADWSAGVVLVNGHGGNTPARPAAEAWAKRRKGVTLRWHDWWKAPRTRAAIDAIDPTASHASWMESFPWTRVADARPPKLKKPRVDLPNSDLTPGRAREIVHCDVSPTNLLVSEDGFLEVIDFGIARTRGQAPPDGHAVPGKLSYMSPEQARRQPLDHRSDIFSLGVVLYEIALGRRLFRGPAQEVYQRLTRCEVSTRSS